jgi:DNA-binding transcriptional ArsR family regulator
LKLFNTIVYNSEVVSSRASKGRSTDDRLDLVFQALADRTRRALLARLAHEPSKITDLAEPFEMSLPAVSRHIRVLERARLVRRTVDGRVHRCSLTAQPLRSVEAWLGHYRPFWDSTLDALARYVERD